ncbi:hypothetical protein EC973_001467 [Apophysomyces ossiformis]|uniref:Striatin N-terminal domain-containing protein n=1 Tax=Apophysomyces ossiformis TaxID=679940 RepID=A0A8H7BJR3_9FUNG|nr:hypothetical protein EC973_001467 [Apophysomyces ossiformis]
MLTDSTMEYTLPGVLHFLQAEWRRFERERNEWAIERAELKARIALLEGERRGAENLKMDLMKRVKMLEYALKQERKRHVTSAKQRNGNIIEETTVDSPNARKTFLHIAASSPEAHNAVTVKSLHKATDENPRASIDSRTRERSRQALKSCLQEINYLTSMPTKFPLTHSMSNAYKTEQAPSRASSIRRAPNSTSTSTTSSPVLSSASTPSPGNRQNSNTKSNGTVTKTIQTNRKGSGDGTIRASSQSSVTTPVPLSHPKHIPPMLITSEEKSSPTMATTTAIVSSDLGQPTDDTIPVARSLSPPPPGEDVEVPANVDEVAMFTNAAKLTEDSSVDIAASSVDENTLLSKQVQEKYNLSEDKVQRMMKSSGKAGKRNNRYIPSPEPQENNLSFEISQIADMETQSSAPQSQPKIWRTKVSIKGHLDSVRTVSFHPKEMIIASGSDDGTVKVWNLERTLGKAGIAPKKMIHEEVDPDVTYRGHTNIVTSVTVSAEQNRVYSAGLDSTIRVWRLPPEIILDPLLNIATYVGHTDSIWDLKLFPISREDSYFLASASADGTVKIWDTQTSEHSPAPTSLDFCPTDLDKIAVSYTNAKIQIFDIETGQVSMTLAGSDSSYDGTQRTQINRIVTHPTMPLLISGHEDKQIKFFDLKSGKCTFSMSAHLDAVSCLDIDSGGMALVSGGHDASIRLWDISMTKTCTQEFSVHRKKGDEGVLDVHYHPSFPWMVSGGADGIVKVYYHGH